MTKTITKTRESGFTLLELLLVIGVAALLLIGGIATYRLVSEGNRTTDSTRLLLTIRQQAQTMAQQQGGAYTGITYTSLAADPSSPFVVNGTLNSLQKNPFNGSIVITSESGDSQLQVAFANVPKSACVRLLQAVNNPSEIVSVTPTGGTSFTSAGNTIPVNAANAATACNTATATGGVTTVTWIFP